jgi:hypothetical protein
LANPSEEASEPADFTAVGRCIAAAGIVTIGGVPMTFPRSALGIATGNADDEVEAQASIAPKASR